MLRCVCILLPNIVEVQHPYTRFSTVLLPSIAPPPPPQFTINLVPPHPFYKIIKTPQLSSSPRTDRAAKQSLIILNKNRTLNPRLCVNYSAPPLPRR